MLNLGDRGDIMGVTPKNFFHRPVDNPEMATAGGAVLISGATA